MTPNNDFKIACQSRIGCSCANDHAPDNKSSMYCPVIDADMLDEAFQSSWSSCDATIVSMHAVCMARLAAWREVRYGMYAS